MTKDQREEAIKAKCLKLTKEIECDGYVAAFVKETDEAVKMFGDVSGLTSYNLVSALAGIVHSNNLLPEFLAAYSLHAPDFYVQSELLEILKSNNIS